MLMRVCVQLAQHPVEEWETQLLFLKGPPCHSVVSIVSLPVLTRTKHRDERSVLCLSAGWIDFWRCCCCLHYTGLFAGVSCPLQPSSSSGFDKAAVGGL